MDVFMHNIAFAVNTSQVVDEISKILHGSLFSEFTAELPSPLNFKVFLHQQRRTGRTSAGGHKGTGILTLPTESVGLLFLRLCGGKKPQIPVILGSRGIIFEKSTNIPRKEVIETIVRTPFVDPRVVQKRHDVLKEFQTSTVDIKILQFGWECRDEILSIEWQKYFPEEPFCTLKFEGERREIRISFHTLSMVDEVLTQTVALHFSSIISLVTSQISSEPAIVISLDTPPTYEVEIPPSFNNSFRPKGAKEPQRRRLSHFVGDLDHERIAPYACLAIRLVCKTPSDLYKFHHLAEVARLRWEDHYYKVEKRNLFSTQNMEGIQRWLARLSVPAWPVAYQIDALLKNWSLDGKEVLSLGDHIVDCYRRQGVQYTAEILKDFGSELKELWSSDSPVQDVVQYFKEFESGFSRSSLKKNRSRNIDNNIFQCFHVTVTPSAFCLEGPIPERSNRVIRAYNKNSDYFLRVSFADETHFQYRFDRDVDGPRFIKERVGGILHNGITIGGKFFSFLAYSQSALKEHSVWFITPFKQRVGNREISVDASSIIRDLGSFGDLEFDPRLIFCPARYGARISQAFTATDSSISVEAEEIFYIQDIKRDGSCFTDGVGTLSTELANDIWNAISSTRNRLPEKNRVMPKAFQIRFMGSKGMLSVDYTLAGRAICLRPSMIKFESPQSLGVEIAQAFDKPGGMRLNRPLITLLEGLGVKPEVFLDLQRKAVRELRESTTSLNRTARLLESYGLGASFHISSVLLNLHKLNVKLDDPIYSRMIDIAMNHILRELKHHARIPVPGWSLVGVADEHGYLEEGQIFACVRTIEGKQTYLRGPVMISRSPTIHPGDVQMVNAIGPPPRYSSFEREPLQNTVVFSTKGNRSLPSCLGGGDLDGDLYNVTEFVPLHPSKLYEAAAYPPAHRLELNRPSTMEDVADFVVDYINNNILGLIATNWMIKADQSSKNIIDEDCLLLARLHSDAVDYPKSGRAVPISTLPKPKRDLPKPDWSAPEITTGSTTLYYKSSRALGQLYRDIDLPAIDISRKKSTRHDEDNTLSDAMSVLSIRSGDRSTLYQAVHNRVSEFLYIRSDSRTTRVMLELFIYYSAKIRNICANYTLSRSRSSLLSEEEVLIGTIVAKSSQPRRRQDLMSKLRDETKILVENIKEDILYGDDSASITSGSSSTPPLEKLKRAWLAWEAANAQIQKDEFGSYSFWWISLDAIFESIRSIENDERRSNFGR